jgi:hypothetical protein
MIYRLGWSAGIIRGTAMTDCNPHETGALVRMHDAGWPVPEVARLMGKTITQINSEMRKGLEEREEATRAGRPVHA